MFNTPQELFASFNSVERTLFDEWFNKRGVSGILAWFPVLLVLAVLWTGWFGFTFLVCYHRMYVHGYQALATFGIISFNILFAIGNVSFIRAVFTKPGSVPKHFAQTHLQEPDLNNLRTAMRHQVSDPQVKCSPLATISDEESMKYYEQQREAISRGYVVCRRCEIPRPPRSHHCRICKHCTLKMDHHCPVINNCVGFYNYKYFFLSVMYACIGCTEGAIYVILYHFLDTAPFEGTFTDYGVYISFVIGSSNSIALFLLGMFHLYVVLTNQSTLEVIAIGLRKAIRNSAKTNNAFDVGWKNNFIQVFGPNPFLWFLPVFTAQGDGCSFPVKENMRDSISTRGGSLYALAME